MLGQLVRGALAGAAATWVMDQVTTAMLDAQSAETKQREQEVRPNGRSSAANLVASLEASTGVELSEPSRGQAAMWVHWALGVVPGAIYAVLRRHVPALAAGGGLLYGALLFLANDEAANTALGLAAAPDAYPIETHVRGLAGHLVLGAVTDSVIDVLGG